MIIQKVIIIDNIVDIAEDFKDFIGTIKMESDNDLEELNDLEYQLIKLKSSLDPKSSQDDFSDVNSPTNKKTRIIKSSSNKRSTFVTIDLNPIK